MKAEEKIKKGVPLEAIYEDIKNAPDTWFKHFIPHFIYVSDEVKSQMLRDGFKLSYGDWDGQMKNCLIIEW